MSTVLICDDHRIVREGLRTFIGEVPGVEQVLTAASGEEVLARYAVDRPDLILLDLHMPGLGGLATLRRLLSAHPAASVVMLTAADDRDHVAAAITAGAKGYLVKDISREDLCAAAGRALAGHDLVEPSLRRAYAERVSRGTENQAPLTERELQVLRGMSQGKSNSQIGKELFLSEDTIKTHARRLFRKMNVRDRAQAVASGFRQGLVS
ncbi:MAG TPA: response regulator transcription factor [Mycobacteriales bacterium]|nr:response regulator transcription factor [Mycobacteriales bacterium]